MGNSQSFQRSDVLKIGKSICLDHNVELKLLVAAKLYSSTLELSSNKYLKSLYKIFRYYHDTWNQEIIESSNQNQDKSSEVRSFLKWKLNENTNVKLKEKIKGRIESIKMKYLQKFPKDVFNLKKNRELKDFHDRLLDLMNTETKWSTSLNYNEIESCVVLIHNNFQFDHIIELKLLAYVVSLGGMCSNKSSLVTLIKLFNQSWNKNIVTANENQTKSTKVQEFITWNQEKWSHFQFLYVILYPLNEEIITVLKEMTECLSVNRDQIVRATEDGININKLSDLINL